MKYNDDARGFDACDSTYDWDAQSGPGRLEMLHKDHIHIEAAYQRQSLQSKISAISTAWSWLSFGALVVGRRDGRYWVIDGQHRLLAARKRSDVTHVPCVVFQTKSVKSEAKSFLDLNTFRRPVSAVSKQKAMVAAQDEVAVYVQRKLESLGVSVTERVSGGGQIKSVAWCTARAAENRSSFDAVIELCAELSGADDLPIKQRLLDGLWVINARVKNGLYDKRLVKRLREKGARVLLNAAGKASAFYANGGGKVWAQGMLAEINKGLQRKFVFDESGE